MSYRKIGDVLVAQGNLTEALKSYRDGLAIQSRLAKADPSDVRWRDHLQFMIERIGTLAYSTVLAGDFTNAFEAMDQVVPLASDQLWLHGNRAHALMFLGRIEEARAIYLGHRGAKNVVGEKSWETVVMEDFAELRRTKLMHPLKDEIEKLFAAPG